MTSGTESSVRSLKTRILDLLRAPLRVGPAERAWVTATAGRPYVGLRAKLTPNHYSFQAPSLRTIRRYGFRLDVDISDLVGWYVYFGFRDPSHDLFVAECRPGDVVLDVGANIGITALRASAAVGPAGRVYAFEPDAINLSQLSRHISINGVTNVEIVELGLSDTPGSAHLGVVNAGNRGMNRIERAPAESANGAVVRLTTMDEFVTGRSLERVNVIKADVEGFEGAVLRGAARTLSRFRPTLFLEFDDQMLEYQGDTASGLLALLDDHGYQVYRADTGQLLPAGHVPRNVHVDLVCRPR
jgi:FkbM family methyltransferase